MSLPEDANTVGAITTPVLILCLTILFALVFFWALFGIFSRHYQIEPIVKVCLLCASFASCSWGMNVLSKTLLVIFKTPCLVTFAQMSMTATGTLLFARHKLTWERSAVTKWSCISILFCGMLTSSLFSYSYLTLSMVMIIRNCTPLITLAVERMVMPADAQPNMSIETIVSLMLILAGAAVYIDHQHMPVIGIAFGVMNMILAIVDRVAQRWLLTGNCKSLSTETCVLLNNLLGCAPTLGISFALKEYSQLDAHMWYNSYAAILLVISGIVGSWFCYFGIEVQRELTSTSFVVLHNASRMVVVVAGIFVFKDPLEMKHVVGIVFSFAGTFWYSHLSTKSKEKTLITDATKSDKAYRSCPAPAPTGLGEMKRSLESFVKGYGSGSV